MGSECGGAAGGRGAGVGALPAARALSLCRKECLVSSSGNDNTENGLAGSKAEQKAPPKA